VTIFSPKAMRGVRAGKISVVANVTSGANSAAGQAPIQVAAAAAAWMQECSHGQRCLLRLRPRPAALLFSPGTHRLAVAGDPANN